jgi:O-phosphoseryl-tRNA(Cys) synthetase
LDKFESRSSDGIFLGYASHSHAYRILNLEINPVVETCEVTFDETMPCSVPIFESAGDQEIGESIFVEENEEDANRR